MRINTIFILKCMINVEIIKQNFFCNKIEIYLHIGKKKIIFAII